MITKLRYGNTNTFFIEGKSGSLLIDTDYAGTLPAFFKAAKAAGIDVRYISYLLMTHYHPDHMGIAAELQALGVQLLVIDVQAGSIHNMICPDEVVIVPRKGEYCLMDKTVGNYVSHVLFQLPSAMP